MRTDVDQKQSLNKAIGILARFQRFAWDFAGVAFITWGLMTFLAMLFPNLTSGLLLVWWSEFLWLWFGWGGLWMVVVLALTGLFCLRRRHMAGMEHIRWSRIFALEAAAFVSLALLAAMGGNSLERAEAGLDGGRIGWGLAAIVQSLLVPFGFGDAIWQVVLLGLLFALMLILGLGLVKPVATWMENRVERASQADQFTLDDGTAVSVAPIPGQTSATIPVKETKKRRPSLPPEFRKKLRLPEDEEEGEKAVHTPRDERLPPLDILVNEKVMRPDERHINLTAGLIEKTLSEFGIPAKVIGFQVGPTVTQFAVEPGFVEKPGGEGESTRFKVRVSQISALSRDLTLALSAERLRIQAPVPGRPYIGIEVPNARSMVVRLRPILESEAFHRIGSPLAIALGRNVSGKPVVADLGRMPHLLIAGTTGSGKSVCIAALTTCLAMNNHPDDLRLIMIDPKMVELVRFNGLPHLYGKVETDIERSLGVLRWAVAEMDRRYRLLEQTRSRHLDSYNRKARRRKNFDHLPRIVLMIDELADLMMSAPDQTEPTLVRLAQMARAVGIHLVLATQRPSTDVVTGLIKANFPARISFAVASLIDSRVILDSAGAESLLGRGDMLFLPPEASAPLRAQGVMVSDPEVERVITYWQKTVPSEVGEVPPWEQLLEQEAILADRDQLIEQAIEIVRQTQRASASMLQRRLRIGYPRAARLVDELEELGVVGPSRGGGREREVLLDPADEEEGSITSD